MEQGLYKQEKIKMYDKNDVVRTLTATGEDWQVKKAFNM